MSRIQRSASGVQNYVICGIMVVAFCLPAILNPGRINSDSAIIALQATHFLQGKFDFFVWGTSYQGPVYPLFYALAFLIGGATPLTTILAPVVALCISVCLMRATLASHLPPMVATLAALLLLLSAQMENSFSFFPIRHVSLALLVASIWMINRSMGPVSAQRLFVAALLCGLALMSDLLLLQTLPAMAILGCFAVRSMSGNRSRGIFALAGGVGFPLGMMFIARLMSAGAQSNLQLDFSLVGHNWTVLSHQALPYAFGWRTVLSYDQAVNPVVEVPAVIRIVQMGLGVMFLLATLSGAVLFFKRTLPGNARLIGLVGTAGVVSSLGAFLVSAAPFDAFSARYLIPILVFAPLSVVPILNLLSARIAATVLLPFLIHFAIAGWLSYGDQVQNGLPARADRWALDDETALRQLVRDRNIRHGLSGYWHAYRLTFLFEREAVIVPFQEFLDRSPGYRAQVGGASRTCAIFHSNEPAAEPDSFERMLLDRGLSFERKTVGKYTVFLMPP